MPEAVILVMSILLRSALFWFWLVTLLAWGHDKISSEQGYGSKGLVTVRCLVNLFT